MLDWFSWFRSWNNPHHASMGGVSGSVLSGKALRYLIGAEDEDLDVGLIDCLTEVPYDYPPLLVGTSIAYCNLFWQRGAGDCAPYLEPTDTAEDYDEKVIDPQGLGWNKNIIRQCELRKKQGFKYIEFDNPDAYAIEYVLDAINIAASYGLHVIAKNPCLFKPASRIKYVSHPNIHGIITEKDCGTPQEVEDVRRLSGKLELPCWFVSYGDGRYWAERTGKDIWGRTFYNMGVTHSSKKEYRNSENILLPMKRAA